MKYVQLGNSNLKVSRIGVGAMGFGDPNWRPWVLKKTEARPIVKRAIELGINFFDTSNYYSNGESEKILGSLLKEMVNREDVVIATKFGNPMGNSPNTKGYSRKHIIHAVEDSLRRLDTDYIDLYQTHIWDESTHIEELLEALHLLIQSGKVLYVGATDMPLWKFSKAVFTARKSGIESFQTMQYHYNLIWRDAEHELITMCESEGIGLLPYSPMARGFLTSTNDKTTRNKTDEYLHKWYNRYEDVEVREAVNDIAYRKNISPAEVSLAWVLNKLPGATPILGATRCEHIDSAVRTLEIKLSKSDLSKLEKFYGGFRGLPHK